MVINIVADIRRNLHVYAEMSDRSFDHNTIICILYVDSNAKF